MSLDRERQGGWGATEGAILLSHRSHSLNSKKGDNTEHSIGCTCCVDLAKGLAVLAEEPPRLRHKPIEACGPLFVRVRFGTVVLLGLPRSLAGPDKTSKLRTHCGTYALNPKCISPACPTRQEPGAT